MDIGKIVKVTQEPDLIPVVLPKPQPKPVAVPNWPKREPAPLPEKVKADGRL